MPQHSPEKVSKRDLSLNLSTFERREALREHYDIPGKERAIWRYAKAKSAQSCEGRLAEYSAQKADFEEALLLWDPESRNRLRDMLESMRFVDYEHVVAEIVEAFRSRGAESLIHRDLQFKYNRCLAENDPEFNNMKAVNAFLKQTALPCGIERLLKVHCLGMKGGVDKIESESLGNIRDYEVGGYELELGLTPLELRRIQKNPYLDFVEDARYRKRKEKTGRTFGYIQYPEPVTVKDSALERIQDSRPEVYQRLLEFKSQSQKQQDYERRHQSETYQELTRALVTALLEERYEHFQRESARYIEMDTPRKVLEYIKCVALHYRDVISIHPLGDGNGRSIRYECLYAPLDRAGISRPRLMNPNLDILHSPSGWVEEVQRAILSTDALYRDVAERIRMGLRVENSPEILFPNLSREVGIRLSIRGRKRSEENVTLAEVDGAEFGAFLDTRLSQDQKLRRAFSQAPLESMQALRDEYKSHVKKNLIHLNIPGKGTELVGLHLVDLDFRSAFAVPFSKDSERWRYKLRRWYHNESVWRGMCDTESELSTEQALDMFRKPNWISLSNYLSGYSDAPLEQLVDWIGEEFDRYNQDLVQGTLYEQVIAHVEEGEGYDESYGLSTSKRRAIAASFAWGKGSFGYEDRDVRAAQSEIQSRVLVGALRSKKGVDVSRFKALDPRFSYEFGRQQEVLEIGGLDPDAILLVQLLDSRKRVIQSFARNPEKPSEVWQVKGACSPFEKRLRDTNEDRIIAVHSLFS